MVLHWISLLYNPYITESYNPLYNPANHGFLGSKSNVSFPEALNIFLTQILAGFYVAIFDILEEKNNKPSTNRTQTMSSWPLGQATFTRFCDDSLSGPAHGVKQTWSSKQLYFWIYLWRKYTPEK